MNTIQNITRSIKNIVSPENTAITEEYINETYGYPIITYPDGNIFNPTVVRVHNKKLYELQKEYMRVVKLYAEGDDSYKNKAENLYDEYLKEFITEMVIKDGHKDKSL